MKRILAAALASILVVLVVQSCHETQRDDTASVARAGDERVAPATEKPSASARAGDALAAANDAVEASRILALPLNPLPSEAIQGVALPTYSELPGLSYEAMVSRIRDAGANHVSVVVSWHQRTIHHNRLRPHPDETLSDRRLGEVIDAAHRADLGVLLFPIIHVERRAEGEWRGRLAPTNPERWRADYRAFVLHYADLAAKHGVEIYSVGSELSSLEGDTDFWRGLIADVRARFPGKLVYSANWDHYDTPQFWDAVDFVGVSSYFEVARRHDEPIHVVTERWRRHREQLTSFAKKQRRPLLLTEVGYPSTDLAAVKPWDYTSKTPPNQNAQLAAYRSLAEAWSHAEGLPEGFAGLYIWHGWGHGGVDDVSYPVWGKTSEQLIRRWYTSP